MPYEKLMYDLTSSYILYHEGKLKRALESFESIQLRLKNRKMLVFDNELTYFIKNFEKKKAQLPQPNHYYEWLAYTTIKNGP